MGTPERNVVVDNVWYGPDYPENGQPPAGKLDLGYLNRKDDDSDDEPVGGAAVTTPEQARKFSGGQPVAAPDVDEAGDAPDIDPVGSKAVQSAEEAATFRGRPTRRAQSTTKAD